MIKAVYDTNVVVSGLLNPEGIPSLILDLATQGYIRLFLSEEIVKEYEAVLIRPKFSLSRKHIKRLLQKLRTKGKVVKPKTSVKVLKDPADNKFLECALSGKAKYFVTGNTRHVPLRNFGGIKIVTPREFWEIYKQSIFTSLK